MKSRLLVVLFVGLVAACTPVFNYDTEMVPDLGVQTPQDALQWVAQNITYVSDQSVHQTIDEWQLPHQTYIWRTGDCEDFSVLVAYLVDRDTTSEVRVMMGGNGSSAHAWVVIDGVHYEPQSGKRSDHLPKEWHLNQKSYSVQEALEIANRRSVL